MHIYQSFQTHIHIIISSSFWRVTLVLSAGAYTIVHDIICHYCTPLLGDLPEDVHVENQNMKEAHHKWQTIVFVDSALVRLNADNQSIVKNMENIKNGVWHRPLEIFHRMQWI
jgi:hypothetical protein